MRNPFGNWLPLSASRAAPLPPGISQPSHPLGRQQNLSDFSYNSLLLFSSFSSPCNAQSELPVGNPGSWQGGTYHLADNPPYHHLLLLLVFSPNFFRFLPICFVHSPTIGNTKFLWSFFWQSLQSLFTFMFKHLPLQYVIKINYIINTSPLSLSS